MQIIQEMLASVKKRKKKNKLTMFLSGFAVVMSIWGTITFSLFILEEAFQTAMFGTWPAQDANRWDLVRVGTLTMDKTAKTLRTVNYAIGWVQPLAFFSYKSFGESAQVYIDSLNAKALAHAPDLFIGEVVSLRLRPNGIEYVGDSQDVMLFNGQVGIICREDQRGEKIYHVSGKLLQVDGKFVVDIR